MAYSYIEYAGDGVTTTFSVPFDYMASADIKVFIDGVEDTSKTFVSSGVVQTSTVPSSGALVRVERNTDITNRAVDFSSGSVLTEEDLDTSAIQVFYAAQEAIDTAEEGIFKDTDGKYDAKGRVLKNVANPTEATDAVNKTYLEDEWLSLSDKEQLNALDIPKLNRVYDSVDKVDNVSDNMADVTDVNANMSDINSVADQLDTISSAVTAAGDAAASAQAAATSEGNASDSADAAALSAGSASGFAQAAADSQIAAQSSETNAGLSEASASAASAAAVAALTEYRGEWLGSFVNDPLVDGNSQPLDGGELYYNSATQVIKVYDGNTWVDTSLQFNLGGLTNLDTSKTNYEYEGDGKYPVVTDQDYRILLGVKEGTGDVFGKSLIDKTYLGQERFYRFTGEGGTNYPIVTDNENRIILGIKGTTGEIIGRGFLGTEYLGEQSQAEYFGDGDIYPIVTDFNYRVLLGVEKATGTIVGDITQATGTSGSVTALPTETPMEDLPPELQVEIKDVNHLLFYGQSLSVGAAGKPALSLTQPYSNLTFNGGPRAYNGDYSSFKPLVEDDLPAPDGGTNRGETCCAGAANYAVTLNVVENGATPSDHVVLSSTAGHGGYSISQLELGTTWYQYVVDHIQNGYDNSVANGDTYACHMVGWLQGENDVGVSTRTQQWYYDKFIALQSDIENTAQGITGQTTPVFLCTYQLSWYAGSNPKIAHAQLEACRNSDKHFLATPTYHIPFAGDRVHLTNIGYKLIGHYYGRIYKQVVIDKKKPVMFDVKSATYRDNVVYVKFDVPVKPLVLDYDNLAVTTDYGFKIVDDTGTLNLSNFEIINGDTVAITVDRTLSGNPKVRYALDYLGAGLIINNGASGNLRDSEPETTVINGNTYNLFNVAPHFEQDIITLG